MTKKISVFIVLVILITLLSGCQNQPPSSLPTDSIDQLPSPEVTLTPTSFEPTETPNPRMLILIPDEKTRESITDQISDFLQQFAQENNLLFEKSTSVSEINLEDTEIIVIENPGPEELDLAAQSSKTKLIYISDKDNQLSENEFQVLTQPGQKTFIAGYLAALITTDWRTGGLLPSGIVHSTEYWQIFQNGTKYLCGRCTPVYAPVIPFPVTLEISEAAGEQEVISGYEELQANRLEAIYIPSEFLSSPLVAMIEQAGVKLISTPSNSEGLSDLADIVIDEDIISPLRTLVTQSDLESQIIKTSIKITDKSESITQGRQENLDNLINNIEEGFISPYTIFDNQTGE